MQKDYNENLFRPIFIEDIKYFLIGKRNLENDFEVPYIFKSELLSSISYMPKSIIQIIDPGFWYADNIRNNRSCHIDLNILFDDYLDDDYDFLFEIPSKVIVFLLNTDNQKIFEKLFTKISNR